LERFCVGSICGYCKLFIFRIPVSGTDFQNTSFLRTFAKLAVITGEEGEIPAIWQHYPNVCKVKNKFQLEEEGTGIIFLRDLYPAAVQDCTKFRILITNVLLQLARDVINGSCYQRYEKRLEQLKGCPNQSSRHGVFGGLRSPNKVPSTPKLKYETL